MATITLKGITWNHSRGYSPLVALAQRFHEFHPNVEILWEKRSLQAFADQPIENLTRHYDLLIIDHPWVGTAAATGCVLPLDEYLPPVYLQDQEANSVGVSHKSYHYGGHQWALAIDAATPVASYRPDLLTAPPATWDALLALADEGKVAVPAIAIDLLMNFYSFCLVHGQAPFEQEGVLIERETGLKAMDTMRQLYSRVHQRFFHCNPIAVADIMSSSDDYSYCPFAYGYSNYSRKGYASRLLQFADTVWVHDQSLQTTLGGTGIAVSAFSQHQQAALDFARMLCDADIQQSIYVQSGGQPGHRAAWTNNLSNTLTNNYFQDTLPVLDRAYLRPRYHGYLHFQDHAGEPLRRFLMGEMRAAAALEKMEQYYRESISRSLKPATA